MARNGSWKLRSYNFPSERDPECDHFQAIWQKQNIKEDDLAALAGLSTQTVTKMFSGQTRQPRHSTFAKMAAAMGKEYGLKDMREPNYETEIPQAKRERKLYRAWLKRTKLRKKGKR